MEEERSKNMLGLAGECEMRIGFLFVYFLQFYMDQSASRKRKLSEDSKLGSKRKKES